MAPIRAGMLGWAAFGSFQVSLIYLLFLFILIIILLTLCANCNRHSVMLQNGFHEQPTSTLIKVVKLEEVHETMENPSVKEITLDANGKSCDQERLDSTTGGEIALGVQCDGIPKIQESSEVTPWRAVKPAWQASPLPLTRGQSDGLGGISNHVTPHSPDQAQHIYEGIVEARGTYLKEDLEDPEYQTVEKPPAEDSLPGGRLNAVYAKVSRKTKTSVKPIKGSPSTLDPPPLEEEKQEDSAPPVPEKSCYLED